MTAAIDHDEFESVLRAAGELALGEAWRWEAFLKGVPQPVLRAMLEAWGWQAHRGQLVADGAEAAWRVWLLMAGRGFGKTRAGAEWISARARDTADAQIALVGGSRDEVIKVMIEGPSGLLRVARTGEAPEWAPTRGVVTFANGAQAFLYSAEAPEALRGPEHHFAWADELAKWPPPPQGRETGKGDAAWDNLMFGLRLGARPRAVVTTTPRGVALLRRVRGLTGTVETGGTSADNVHLSPAFQAWAAETYRGTRLGRQELGGELIGEAEGALWTRDMIEAARALRHGSSTGSAPAQDERNHYARVVIGVDPPAGTSGTCGICVCAMGALGVLYVLADLSVTGERPEGWARVVARAAEAWGADRVVAEQNQGGDMVGSVLQAVDCFLPVKLVSATRGKGARAEPVAALFELGRARLAGKFPELEDELCGLSVGGYAGPGRSPDRADAMVWAMSALIQAGRRREPRLTRL